MCKFLVQSIINCKTHAIFYLLVVKSEQLQYHKQSFISGMARMASVAYIKVYYSKET